MGFVRIICLVVILLDLATGLQDGNESLVVETIQGKVRGYKESGRNYYAFYGIPYATAPTGPHKFKAPLPPPTWTHTLEASNRDTLCPQGPMILHMSLVHIPTNRTENCLHMNIFKPDSTDKQLPVVIYVHGGGFQMGFGNMLSHIPLVETGKVIEVNFNYRLGVHGFLCLGTEDVPGNAGMKDQVAALRWVNENIAKFGGDPNNVTLAGYSAGAAAVQLLMLSNSTRGLFNKVICESGAAIAPWAIQLDPLAIAKKFALTYGFTNIDDVFALEYFYKTTPVHELVSDPYKSKPDSTFNFVPCVEKKTSADAFLTKPPMDILDKGRYDKLPILIGFTNMEGMFRLPLIPIWMEHMNKKFRDFLPADLIIKDINDMNLVLHDIKKFYFNNKPINRDQLVPYIDYFTDVMFAYPILKSVKLYLESGGSNAYLYHYTYVDDNLPFSFQVKGANHCAQSVLISEGVALNLPEELPSYKDMKNIMVDTWINFISTGTPRLGVREEASSDWPPITLDSSLFMELNRHAHVRRDLRKDQFEFWDNIYLRYYRMPLPPVLNGAVKKAKGNSKYSSKSKKRGKCSKKGSKTLLKNTNDLML